MAVEHGFNATLNLLYALEGMLLGVRWNRIPEERKREIMNQARQRLALR